MFELQGNSKPFAEYRSNVVPTTTCVFGSYAGSLTINFSKISLKYKNPSLLKIAPHQEKPIRTLSIKPSTKNLPVAVGHLSGPAKQNKLRNFPGLLIQTIKRKLREDRTFQEMAGLTPGWELKELHHYFDYYEKNWKTWTTIRDKFIMTDPRLVKDCSRFPGPK